MNIRVKYHNGSYDIVRGFVLDILLQNDKVQSFYRYSESRWVTVGVDKIRSQSNPDYQGERRRSSDLASGQSTVFTPKGPKMAFA